MKKLCYLVAALCVVFGAAATANAAFVLAIDDGLNGTLDVVVADNTIDGVATQNAGLTTVADEDLVLGGIFFDGVIGAWDLLVTVAESKPIVGGPNGHGMGLHVIARSNAAAAIRIGITDTDFLPTSLGSIESNVGGVAAPGATVSVESEKDWLGPGNQEFSGAFFGFGYDTLVTQGPFGTGSFGGIAAVGHGPIPTSYSISHYVTIEHTVGGYNVTSVDSTVHNVPEPASLSIFGGLLGAGCLCVRRRRKR